MKEFNQSKYIQEYNKEHYKAFKVDLKIKEFEELEKILKKAKLTKAEFLRQSIIEYKNRTRIS